MVTRMLKIPIRIFIRVSKFKGKVEKPVFIQGAIKLLAVPILSVNMCDEIKRWA